MVVVLLLLHPWSPRSHASLLPLPGLSQQRYNFTLNAERVLGLVNSQSRPNLAHNNYAPSIVVWPFERNATDPSKDFNNIAGGCQCVGGAFTRDAYE